MPLDKPSISNTNDNSDEGMDGDSPSASDWEGVESVGEHEAHVQVIEYEDIRTPDNLSKAELRAFMVYLPESFQHSRLIY